MDKRSREVAFLAGCVYFTQGALGIAGVTLPLYLRSLQWSVGEITTVTSLAALPWILKILYGLLSDCFPLFGYRRKSYLILFSVISMAGWLILAPLPAEKHMVIAALFLANLGLAAIDVITDGVIVENSVGESSHIFQSIAWGTRSLGAIVSGVSGGWLAEHWQPNHVFLLTACLPMLITGCALWLDEIKRDRQQFKNVWAPLKRSIVVLRKPNLLWFMAILVLSQVSSIFGLPFFFHMKENLGFQETFLGSLISLGWIGVVVTSVFYAKWLSKYPPKRILEWAVLLNAVNIFSTLFIRDESTALLLVFFGGVLGCLTLLPIMSVSAVLTHRTGVEGTLFAVLMSVHNLGQIGFGFLGGKIYHQVGLYPLIVGAGLASLVCLWFVQQLRFASKAVLDPEPRGPFSTGPAATPHEPE